MKHIFVFCVVLLILSATGLAQSPAQMKQQLTPLEQVLNPDGTIKLDGKFKGSIDVKGYKMRTDANGQPQFVRGDVSVASVPADVNWDGQFPVADLNGAYVWTLAVNGTDLYSGGIFTTAGGVAVNNIAKWDGTSWSALGSGINGGGVYALAVHGTDLYVGGISRQQEA